MRESLSFEVLCEEARCTLSSPPSSLTLFGSVVVVGNELALTWKTRKSIYNDLTLGNIVHTNDGNFILHTYCVHLKDLVL